MPNNPYEPFIVDEASGIKVANRDYRMFEEGRKAGRGEQLNTCLLELTKTNGASDLKTLERNITELIYKWQKEWEVKQ